MVTICGSPVSEYFMSAVKTGCNLLKKTEVHCNNVYSGPFPELCDCLVNRWSTVGWKKGQKTAQISSSNFCQQWLQNLGKLEDWTDLTIFKMSFSMDFTLNFHAFRGLFRSRKFHSRFRGDQFHRHWMNLQPDFMGISPASICGFQKRVTNFDVLSLRQKCMRFFSWFCCNMNVFVMVGWWWW
jgi:hypothetical protein